MSEIKPGLFRHLTPDTGDCVSFLRQLSSDERMFADSIPPGVIADVEKTMRHKRAERYEAWAVGIDEQQSKYEAAHEALVNTENDLARCREVANNQRGRIADLERQLAEKQAEIDRLMLEFCPDEMTQKQKETWASHQKPAADEARKPK